MAYDQGLAQRIREQLDEREGISEKKMFGGLAFLLNGHMLVGIVGEELCVRVGKDHGAEALAQPHARPMDFTGRVMNGWVYVAVDGFEADADLEAWIARGDRYASSLPPKGPSKGKKE